MAEADMDALRASLDEAQQQNVTLQLRVQQAQRREMELLSELESMRDGPAPAQKAMPPVMPPKSARGGKAVGKGRVPPAPELVTPQSALARKLASSIGAALIDIFKTNAVDLSEAFQMFDTNGDGFISGDEFRIGLKKLNLGMSNYQLSELMRLLDSDESGGLDYDEFLRQFNYIADDGSKNFLAELQGSTELVTAGAKGKGGLPPPPLPPPPPVLVSDEVGAARKFAMAITGELRRTLVNHKVDLLTAFAKFDTNGDGIISADEFRVGFKGLDFGLTDLEVSNLMAILDDDMSGGLDYDEFIMQFRDLDEYESRNVGDALAARGAKMTHGDVLQEIRDHAIAIQAGYKPGQKKRDLSELTPAHAALKELIPFFPETKQFLNKVETRDTSTSAIPNMLRGSPPTRGSGPGRSPTKSGASSATSTRMYNGSNQTGSGVGRTGGVEVTRTVSPSRLAEQRKRLLDLQRSYLYANKH
jgi:Ca2+-binding EF-hand superfamily protein